MIFCDTSTAAKLYVLEPESAAVRPLLEFEDQVCLSDLARTEMLAVFHRRLSEGTWQREEFQTAMRQFATDDMHGFWTWLPLDRSITEDAARVFTVLLETMFLRPGDCLHLVTAIRHDFVEVHTHDRHQTMGARTLGLRPISVGP